MTIRIMTADIGAGIIMIPIMAARAIMADTIEGCLRTGAEAKRPAGVPAAASGQNDRLSYKRLI